MNDYEHALRELCMKVEGFQWVSRDIIFPESKRKQRLKKFAEELRIAARDFVKVINDENKRLNEREQGQRDGGRSRRRDNFA